MCNRPGLAVSRHHPVAWAVLAACVVLGGNTRQACGQTFDEPGFLSETVVTLPAFQPVGVTWAADGTMFIWQKNGVVRVVRDGQLQPLPFIDLSGQVNTYDDRGFLGLALDPDFAQNGHVYLAYVHEPGGDPNHTGPRQSRIVRVTADAGRTRAVAGSEHILIDGIPADSGSHNIGTLRFAPDGTLFVSSGDGATAAYADPLALGAQDLASYRGKILRITADGSAPAPPRQPNPFYDGSNSVRSKVWAYGLRNPYRFAIHPVLGALYAGDVGWFAWEEINRITPGANYGWPCWEGASPQPQYQAQFPEVCAAVTAQVANPPLYAYGRSLGSAVVGGAFYTAAAYPARFAGNFFFADYTGGWIRRLALNADGSIASNVRFASGLGAPVSLELGPDGTLYYPNFVTGQVRRIRYNGPVAAASATPASGYSPLTVAFSSAGSRDGLGGPLAYAWDFGDGASSSAADPVHTYVAAGVRTFDATLTVTHQGGLDSRDTVRVTLGSRPPVPQILTPAAGTQVAPGQMVSYSGMAADPDEGLLPAAALRWDVLLHHNDHVHSFLGSSGATGSFVAEFHGAGDYAYELLLHATDTSGLSATASITIGVNAGDTDGDGVPDTADNCTAVANPDQLDADADGYGNRCDADLDNSGGNVNFTDLAIFRAAFGGSAPSADFDGSGSVNFADLAILRALFGKPPGPSAGRVE